MRRRQKSSRIETLFLEAVARRRACIKGDADWDWAGNNFLGRVRVRMVCEVRRRARVASRRCHVCAIYGYSRYVTGAFRSIYVYRSGVVIGIAGLRFAESSPSPVPPS